MLLASKPLAVTNLLPPIVKPSLLIVVAPVVTLVKPVNSLASLTFNTPLLLTTPMLFSESLDASA